MELFRGNMLCVKLNYITLHSVAHIALRSTLLCYIAMQCIVSHYNASIYNAYT